MIKLKDTAFNTKTQEDYKQLMKKIEENLPNARWAGGGKPTECEYWEGYKEKTAIIIEKREENKVLGYSSIQYSRSRGMTIIDSKEYINEKKTKKEKTMKNKKTKSFPFKIGADPEFNIEIQGKKIKAIEAIKQLMVKQEDRDDANSNEGAQIGEYGIFGWDGHNPTGEIRPTPSKSPKKVVNNLRKMFEAWAKITTLFDLSTLSKRGTVGGHIHLEISDETAENQTELTRLHKTISTFCLPLMIGENKANIKTRLENSYGKISDYRVEERDNGDFTYEYRVPTAEWLTTPEIAEATLAYMATILYEYQNNKENINKFKDIIYTTEKQGEVLQTLAIADYKILTKGLVNKIKKAIKTFEYYNIYKKEIDYILNIQKIVKDKQKVNYNIMKGWGLSQKKQPTKKDLLNVKTLKQKSKKCDLDKLSKLIEIAHNPDYNVEIFAKELQQRVIALNWKLEKTYFLFGLRKGIKETMARTTSSKNIYGIKEQCKTQLDYDEIQKLFRRMEENFQARTGYATENCPKKEKDNEIIIGIPYNSRVELNTKKLIEIIYQIEKNNTKAENIDFSKLKDDRGLEETEKGKIYKIMNKIITENSLQESQSSYSNMQATFNREESIDENNDEN